MKNTKRWFLAAAAGVLLLLGWSGEDFSVQAVPAEEGRAEDYEGPAIQLTYTEAYRLVKDEGKDPAQDGSGTPMKGYTAYYQDDIGVTFTTDTSGWLVELYKDGELIPNPAFVWNETKEGICQGLLSIKKGRVQENDGAYQIRLSRQDGGEFLLKDEESEAAQFIGAQEIYESPLLILDTGAPEIKIVYQKPDGSEAEAESCFQGRTCFQEQIKMVLTVKEAHGRYKELKEVLKTFTAEEIDGSPVPGSFDESLDRIAENSCTSAQGTVWEFELSTDANYRIPIAFEDLAGNRTIPMEELVTVDTESPELVLSNATEKGGFQDAVNYKEDGFLFADRRMTVTVKARDKITGIGFLQYQVLDEEGKEIWKETGKTDIAKDDAAEKETVCEIVLPIDREEKNFKGTLCVEVYDGVGNRAWKRCGCIVESEEMHTLSGRAAIMPLTLPGRTVSGTDYYNTDIELELLMKDSYSGLSTAAGFIGADCVIERDFRQAAGTNLEEEAEQERTFEFCHNLVLKAEEHNENEILVRAEYKDNAGYAGKTEKIFHIDITPPQLEVTYDLNAPSHGKYYHQTRTATVTVRERNFSERDVDFQITGTEGRLPVISEWTHGEERGDNTEHTCKVTFCEDGDYTFTLSCMDLAGNKASYGKTDSFTIDKTRPVMTVTYDNYQSQNVFYYRQKRTAMIDIEEHNFDAALIDAVILAQNETGSVPSLSAWRSNGDHHTATVTFGEDAKYSFQISGCDLAGNEFARNVNDSFVIDQTAPEVKILNVSNRSANQGEVRPKVRCTDMNYDWKGTEIRMSGYKNGETEFGGNTVRKKDGVEVLMDDFEHIPEKDDMYTISVSACDLAGNSREASIVFSVNRFGSIYTFDEKTEKLTGERGSYYTNQEQELVITETNVDTLEFKEITCNLNGKLHTLREGTDYTAEVSGDDRSWKQYTYRIFAENFREEGAYLLTIYSEDRASNRSDSNSKGKRIAFIMDKTGPSILISGVEDNGQYWESSREVTLDIQDNVFLKEVTAEVDGQKRCYNTEELLSQNGIIYFRVKSASHWQPIRVTAYDAAGNQTVLDEMRVLVTANLLVQFFRNRILFCGTLGLGILAAGVVCGRLILAKRKKNY